MANKIRAVVEQFGEFQTTIRQNLRTGDIHLCQIDPDMNHQLQTRDKVRHKVFVQLEERNCDVDEVREHRKREMLQRKVACEEDLHRNISRRLINKFGDCRSEIAWKLYAITIAYLFNYISDTYLLRRHKNTRAQAQ